MSIPPTSDHTGQAGQQVAASTGIPVFPPLTALVETAVLFALIYGLDALLPNIALLDASPHPFWIPVLLVSLQYGTVSGFIAAAIAIALTLVAGLPEQDIGENLFAYFLRVWGQPILWIGVALLVGQFRMRQLAAKHELRLANAALMRQRDDLARHSGDLRARVETLEQELATRYGAAPHVTAAMLAQTMAAGGLGVDSERQGVFFAASTALFPGAVTAAYRLRNGVLAECAVAGRPADRGPRIRIEADDPLFRAVVGEGKVVSVLDPGDERLLGGTGLAAAPIPADEAGSVFGMVVIERADPLILGDKGLAALELLGQALTPRPRQEQQHHQTRLALPRRVLAGAGKVVARASQRVASEQAQGTSKGSMVADRRQGLVELLQQATPQKTAAAAASPDAGASPIKTTRDSQDAASGATPNP